MVASNDFKLRFGHIEGLTQVCYNDSGEFLISCGYDGEVRIWKDIDDDDPNTITVGEKSFSIATKENTLYIASDNNAVERYILPDGSSDGILVRFTGNATNICVSESRKYVAAGSSDFDIKVINLESKKQKCYLGHQAPVLSVSLDPFDEYLASSSCDGNLKIWNLHSEACEKTINVITNSNDVSNSKCLAGVCWRPATGEDVAVAVTDGIKIFSRVTWDLLHFLKTTATDKAFQCCRFSPCGRFITGGSVDGWVVVWDAETQDCVRTFHHPKKSFICSIVWDPRENNCLALSDYRGQVGVLKDVVPSEKPTTKDLNDLDALFEEEDDNMMMDLMAQEDNQQDEAEIAVLKRKVKSSFLPSDDDDDVESKKSDGLPPIPSTMEVLARIDDDGDDVPSSLPAEENPNNDVTSRDYLLTNHQLVATSMQPPFQPGSTPAHLTHRFMVWNTVGVVRSYNDEFENAIDIEFHNTRTHHPLHIDNSPQFTMADLSDKAVVLACEATEDSPSKLKCVHFSSWDSNKEWSVNMPLDETIHALTIGDCWIAVCTDALQVRLLSLGGVQRQIFSLPGSVVAMAAHTDQLLVVYHVTQGMGRSQCLGYILIEVGAGSGCKPRNIVGGSHFPISPTSTVSWLGFTAEGTPASVDSRGVVRMLNRKFCNTWTQVADTRQTCKSRHDHHWVVGLHENPQQIRSILCKGVTFPPTLPRPTLTVLDYNLPLCEMESEKSKLEEEYWKTSLLSSHGDYLTSRGYEPDVEGKKKSELRIQHSLMKLFAFCCKTDSEFQAAEVCSLMPTLASVNLAIKYSSRLRKIILAQKLQEVAQDKLEEERREVVEEEEEEEDFRAEMQAGYSTSATEWGTPSSSRNDEISQKDDASVSSSPRKPPEPKVKPTRSLSSQLAGTRRNPFKQTAEKTSSAAPPSGSVLDNIKRASPAPNQRTMSEKVKKTKTKDNSKKSKATQSTLKVNLTSTPKQKKGAGKSPFDDLRTNGQVLQESSTNHNSSQPAPKSGVHRFIDHHLEELRMDNPDANGVELRKMAIQMFRALSPDDKQKWNAQVEISNSPPPAQKRKHESDDEKVDNALPADESTNQMRAPCKNLKLNDDVIAIEPNENDPPRSRLSAFAYSGAE